MSPSSPFCRPRPMSPQLAQRRRNDLCEERPSVSRPDSYKRISAARNNPNAAQVTTNWIKLIVK
jgi:hypothetical protein